MATKNPEPNILDQLFGLKMSLHDQKFSELVYLALYSEDTLSQEPDELAKLLALELKVAKSHARSAIEKAQEIIAQRDRYDKEVQTVLIGWDLKRLQRPERIVFWLSLHELSAHNLNKVIQEAKRLAKKFSMPKAVHFVHAVVTAVAKQRGHESEIVDLKAAEVEYESKEETDIIDADSEK